jgi:uncharacterized protein YcbK (DUF882 family)
MGVTSEHFTNEELKCRGTNCCGGVNDCQQSLVDALEALRSIVGVPIAVDDAYRCPIHNAAVGGVPNSQHELGIAADIKIQIPGITPSQAYHFALQVPAFANGGIGVGETYLHVDCRAGKARWTYGADGKQAPWNPELDAPEVTT